MALDLIQQARQMLIIDDLSEINPRFRRLFQFDPTPVYEAISDKINAYQRNNYVPMEWVFPSNEEKICRCGCGAKCEGRRSSWATEECSIFGRQVLCILIGKADFIKVALNEVYDYRCCKCGKCSDDIPAKPSQYGMICTPIHLEHTLPVHQGGGACWLSNFTFMCVDCHKIKSKSERSRK